MFREYVNGLKLKIERCSVCCHLVKMAPARPIPCRFLPNVGIAAQPRCSLDALVALSTHCVFFISKPGLARASPLSMKTAMGHGNGLALLGLALLVAHCSALGEAAEPLAQPMRTLLQTSPTSESGSGDCCGMLAAIGFSSNLPVVVLTSNSGQYIAHHEEQNVTLCTCSNGAGFTDYFGPASAAGRGTSSANFTKKSYKVKTTDDKGRKNDISFLGMPKDDEWVMYGPELDRTMGMRNYLTYNLARASGHYATRTVYCEVFVVDDGKPLNMSHYNGIYIGEEKVKRVSKQVSIFISLIFIERNRKIYFFWS